MTSDRAQLTKDLVWIGFVSTIVGIPFGLWAIPKFRERPWVAAALLTAVGYGTKVALLPH